MTTRRDRERMIAEGTTTVEAELAGVENKLAQAIRERDEARRMLCIEWTEHGPVRLTKEQIAMRYGWNCFGREDGK